MAYEEDAYFQNSVKLYADIIDPTERNRRRTRDSMKYIGKYALTELHNVVAEFREMGVRKHSTIYKFKQYYWDTSEGNTVIMEFEHASVSQR